MADYSRFIAYIYEYVNGTKQYNSGFTKVEVRNGICKLQIVLKNTGRENKVKVYGLVRTQGWLLGIFLGEGQIQRQGLDLRIMTDSRKMGGSDYEFRKIAGLFIQGAEGRTYATAWDEEPLFLEKFVTELPQEPVLTAAETEQEKEEEIFSEITWQEEKKGSDDTDILEEKKTIIEEGPETVTQKAEIPDKSEPKGKEQEEKEEQVLETEKSESQKIRKELQVRQNETENRKEQEEIESEQESRQGQENHQAKTEHSPEEKEERWQTILHSYPRMDPFEDEEIFECIQIAPKDIMMIDQKQWRLGRNSFLLHGYYNYRHLLLGRTEDQRWVLGIPGIYDRQEHFVASRFGFPGFKPTKSPKDGEQAFGYWCRVLQ